MKLYEALAETITSQVNSGYFQPGDKLPSIRQMSKDHKVSISTVQEAYRLLEENHIAEVRVKSGYYVMAQQSTAPKLPNISRPNPIPVDVSQWERVIKLLYSQEDSLGDSDDSRRSHQRILGLGKGTPDVTGKTIQPLLKLMSRLSRNAHINQLTYDSLQGADSLRRQISIMMVQSGCHLHHDDIVITTGCQEALSCSMRAIAKPNDVIAIESPSFYGSMQIIQALSLKALEIPTHPETGISVEALEMALEEWPIKVLQVTPICNNPLGYVMPDENKQRLIALANQYDFAIIEDDIYGDLAYANPRPRSIKSYDTQGRVLYCSSFSKTISPAFRTGWCAPGRYIEHVKHMKYVSTACGSILQPRAIAEFVANGHYARHIKTMRAHYLRNRDKVMQWVNQYFPDGTRMSYPQGGYLLWIALSDHICTTELNQRLTQHHMSIAPGTLFTASKKFGHCLRINYAQDITGTTEDAIAIIGKIAHQLIQESPINHKK
ncbi:aminotransferase-like domain-containing protein [Eionea flava]